jgi:hypothetical protein
VPAPLKLHSNAGPEIERRVAPHQSPAPEEPGRRRIVERRLGHASSSVRWLVRISRIDRMAGMLPNRRNTLCPRS